MITCHLLQPFQILKCAFWHNIERCIYLFNVFIYFMLLNFKRNNGRLFVMLTLVYNPLITRFNIKSVIEFQTHIFFKRWTKVFFMNLFRAIDFVSMCCCLTLLIKDFKSFNRLISWWKCNTNKRIEWFKFNIIYIVHLWIKWIYIAIVQIFRSFYLFYGVRFIPFETRLCLFTHFSQICDKNNKYLRLCTHHANLTYLCISKLC